MIQSLLDTIGLGSQGQELIGDNSIASYLDAIVIFLIIFALLLLVRWFILKKFNKYAQKTRNELDDALINIIKSIKPPVSFFISLYFAVRSLTFPDFVNDVIGGLLFLAIVYQVIRIIQILLEEVVFSQILKRKMGENDNEEMVLGVLKTATNWLLWTFGILVLIQNFGVNITSLVAGLGIGGVAVALAVQNILSDLFSSFSILLDRPFEVGDFIMIDSTMGTVVSIGFKTTRIQSLQGEEIILPNKDITSTQIKNFKRMEERRIPFEVKTRHDVPKETVKKIPLLIEGAIMNTKNTRFDRAHLKSINDSSIVFEVVYYMLTNEYVDFMDAHQEILFKIMDIFEEQNIKVAYPTQTVHIAKEVDN